MILLKPFVSSLLRQSRGIHSSSVNLFKVAIIGANGGIGQPLSLLLKKSEDIQKLALYDVDSVKGVVADLSHIPKYPQVIGFEPSHEGLKGCLRDADITVIVAGMPRRPGMKRSDLLATNASIVAPIILECAAVAPQTMICIVTNPINSLVPMAAHILKSLSVYDHRRLFGITTLDSVRANTFVADAKGLKRIKVHIPVVGGHSESTLIPLISQCVPQLSFPPVERSNLTRRIQTGGNEVLDAKAGMGSATLSMAYATFRFVCSLIEGMKGKVGVVECSFVDSPEGPCDFFATPLVLGPHGVERNMGLGNLIEFELKQLKSVIPELEENIKAGIDMANVYLQSTGRI